MDQQVKPVESVKPDLSLVKKPVATPGKNDGPSLANDTINWSQIAHQLELDAMAGQLVINCIVHSWQDNELQLAYLPELEVIIKPEIKQQIKQALQTRLGVSLSVEFISVPVLNAETPQQARIRMQQEELQSAIESIRQQPMVQKLHAVFGAELIEQSVKKVKE